LTVDVSRDIEEICALVGYYRASCGNCSPTFRGNVTVQSLRVKSASRKEGRKRGRRSTREGVAEGWVEKNVYGMKGENLKMKVNK
jgi:hypothetical protein